MSLNLFVVVFLKPTLGMNVAICTANFLHSYKIFGVPLMVEMYLSNFALCPEP